MSVTVNELPSLGATNVGIVDQVSKNVVDETSAVLIAGVAGKVVDIYALSVSSNIAQTITIRSGTSVIWRMDVPATWGMAQHAGSERPLYRGVIGEGMSVAYTGGTHQSHIYMQITQHI